MKLLSLEELQFDNRFLRELPGDPETKNFRRQVRNACYSYVQPASVPNPILIGWASEVAELLDLDPVSFRSDNAAQVFSGNRLLPGMAPFAMCYGGHQFGNWAGQLGDGRAINLGEVVNQRKQHWTLQLKGAGPTPYSRSADGLAVLRSSLREFLCSEAMFHLGVPTTRALSLVLTGDEVVRDMFYDGNPEREPGAIVCRVAPSFTRFGNFEILAARRELDVLRKLLDFTIRADFSHLLSTTQQECISDALTPEIYEAWFTEVCRRTATMIVHWMRVGFVHGVMNTDNMSILGLTIDYGPYGWLDNYDPSWTPNTTDASGRRYRFGQQPQIAMWNLVQLANALAPVFDAVAPLQRGIDEYSTHFNSECERMLSTKLGFPSDAACLDESLSNDLLTLISEVETDMTIFYRRLADIDFNAPPLTSTNGPSEHDIAHGWLRVLSDAWYSPGSVSDGYRTRLVDWLNRYRSLIARSMITSIDRRTRMNLANPVYVCRNYLAQQVIDRTVAGDYSGIEEFLNVLRNPYREQQGKEAFAAKRPDWAKDRPGCSMLSCSS